MKSEGLADGERRLLAGVALLSGAVNFVAIAVMGLVLAPATPAGGDIFARTAYMASHRGTIAAGWLTWISASLLLLAAFGAVGRILSAQAPQDRLLRTVATYAFAVAVIGAALDISADFLMLAVLPHLAEALVANPADAMLRALFETWDETSVGLTGGVANSLYAVAGGLLTAMLFRVGAPRLLSWLGAVTWIEAALATLSMAFLPATLPAAVALSIFLYIAWISGIAVWCILPNQGVAASKFP